MTNKKVKCTYCDGTGEVYGRQTLENEGTEGCPCCLGLGIVDNKILENFLEKEELANMEEE